MGETCHADVELFVNRLGEQTYIAFCDACSWREHHATSRQARDACLIHEEPTRSMAPMTLRQLGTTVREAQGNERIARLRGHSVEVEDSGQGYGGFEITYFCTGCSLRATADLSSEFEEAQDAHYRKIAEEAAAELEAFEESLRRT